MTVSSTQDDGSASGQDAPPPVQSVHAAAVVRWARVAWKLASYSAHLVFVREQYPDSPRYPQDHWLGSAAGYDAEGSWAAIQAEFMATLLGRYQRSDRRVIIEPDDLWQDTIKKRYRDKSGRGCPKIDGAKPNRMAEYRGDTLLPAFIAQELHLEFLDANRRHKSRRKTLTPLSAVADHEDQADLHEGRAHTHATTDPSELAALNEEAERSAEISSAMLRDIADASRRAWERFSDNQKTLYRLCFIEGMSARDAADVIGKHEGTASKAIFGDPRGGTRTGGIVQIIQDELPQDAAHLIPEDIRYISDAMTAELKTLADRSIPDAS